MDTNVDSDCYAVMSNHAVIKIYNILIPGDDMAVIVEVFEVQENFFFILSILFRNMAHVQT